MKIITIGATTNLRDDLQRRLPNLLVVNAISVEGIGEIAKKSEPVGAIVVELATSVDRMSFEYIRVAFQKVPKIVILNIEDEETSDLTEIARNYEAASVFPEPLGSEQLDTMAHLIRSFVRTPEAATREDGGKTSGEYNYLRFRIELQAIEQELKRLETETKEFVSVESPKSQAITEREIEAISRIRAEMEKIIVPQFQL